MDAKRYIFVTGPESSGGSWVARTIAHVLGVTQYNEWNGTDPEVVEARQARVQHTSLPCSSPSYFVDVRQWLQGFGGEANRFVLTTRDNGISVRSKMRRAGYPLETALSHNAQASRLMGEIASTANHYFFFSYEAVVAHGYTYLRELYRFLDVDSDFMPPVIDANARYLKDPLTEDGPQETVRPSLD